MHKCMRVIDHAAKFVVTVKIRTQLLLRALRIIRLRDKVYYSTKDVTVGNMI